MSSLRISLRVGQRDVLVIGPTTVISEAMLLLSVATMVLALEAAGPGQRVWPALAFVALAALAAVFPDSPAALLALCWYAGAWISLAPETGRSLAWAIPAAIAALTFHAVLGLLAALPPGAELEGRAASGLVARFGLAAAASVLVALPVPLNRGALLPDAAAGVLLLLLAFVPRLAFGGPDRRS